MNNEDAVVALNGSLLEAETTVRAYDTKAQICGVGYIFAIGIVLEIGARIPGQPEVTSMIVFLAWATIILPIILFGAVLYPTRKVGPVLGERGAGAERILYVDTDYVKSVDSLLGKIESSDYKLELAYESMKIAALRNLKRSRFLRALFASTASFIVLFIGQALRAEGLFPV